MSTPNPVTFPALVKGFSWTASTTGVGGAALPTGEAESGATIGIRADGDTAHSAGSYQYLIIVPAGQTTETPAQITAALTKALTPGNYWAAIDQTDMLGTQSSTSAWTAEVPFSIPAPIVQPAPPSGFSAG
jgi:hypothetical protein